MSEQLERWVAELKAKLLQFQSMADALEDFADGKEIPCVVRGAHPGVYECRTEDPCVGCRARALVERVSTELQAKGEALAELRSQLAWEKAWDIHRKAAYERFAAAVGNIAPLATSVINSALTNRLNELGDSLDGTQQPTSASPAKLGGSVDALDNAEGALDRFLKEPHAPSEDALYDAIRWVLAAARDRLERK